MSRVYLANVKDGSFVNARSFFDTVKANIALAGLTYSYTRLSWYAMDRLLKVYSASGQNLTASNIISRFL